LNAQFLHSSYVFKYNDFTLRLKALERNGILDLPGLLEEIKSEIKEPIGVNIGPELHTEPSTEDPLELEEW
jgi:hypothetical protein